VGAQVLNDALPEAAAVYVAFNDSKSPMTYCASVRKQLDALCARAPQLSAYRAALDQLAVVRLLQQLSSLYDVLRIADFEKLAARPVTVMTHATPTTPASNVTTTSTFADIELRVAECVRRKQLELRIDHRSVRVCTRASAVAFSHSPAVSAGVLRFGARSLESASLRHQLRDLCTHVQAAARLIQPAASVAQRRASQHDVLAQQLKVGVLALHARTLTVCVCVRAQGVDDEHAALLARKLEIEKQKERDERERTESETKEAERVERARVGAEQVRLR
jgi:translation initiation factor 3 subunit A